MSAIQHVDVGFRDVLNQSLLVYPSLKTCFYCRGFRVKSPDAGSCQNPEISSGEEWKHDSVSKVHLTTPCGRTGRSSRILQ